MIPLSNIIIYCLAGQIAGWRTGAANSPTFISMLRLIMAVTESAALDPEIAFIARDRDKRETGTGKSLHIKQNY